VTADPKTGLRRQLSRVARLRQRKVRKAALRRLRSRAVALSPVRRPGSTPATGAPRGASADARYAAAWARLARTVLGSGATQDPRSMDPREVTATVTQGATQRAQSMLADALAHGEPLERAVYRAAAALTDAKQPTAAWALAEGVGRLPGGALAAAVGHAVSWHRQRQFERVWRVASTLSDEDLATHLAVEAVDGALFVGTPEARERALAVAAAAERLDVEVVIDLAGRFLAMGDPDAAARLVAEVRRRGPVPLGERSQRSLTLVERWLDPPPRTIPDHAVPFAVMDYQSPDQALTSGNVGDYVQTLALLSNLARLTSVTMTGEDGLGGLATELQSRVRPELRRPEVAGALHLLDVNREFSSVENIPEGTWMVAFGWHMHPLYDLRYDFPYHPNLRPIFVSFHVNRLDMLTEEALAYLREHGPIGCRDWTTVDLLLSAGVDAFFTGCLTSTVDAVFPTREEVYSGHGAVGLIDITPGAAGPVEGEVRTYTHQDDSYRHMSLPDGVHAAQRLLGGYQRTLDRAITRRLHAYLPLTALGVPAQLKPYSPGDVRFAGLTGLRPGAPRLAEMQATIRDLIAEALAAVLGGAADKEVYALWREITAHRVQEAKARFAAPVEDTPTTVDVAAAVATSRAASRRLGPPVSDAGSAGLTDIVLCFDQHRTEQTPVLLESLVTNATGPLRLWVLGRGLPEGYPDWLAAAFPSVPMTFLPCDHIDYGSVKRIPDRITISTMDRLLLPHLLEDVARVIYLDIDTLVLGDVTELARLDLGGSPIAARDSNVSEFHEWRLAAKRLRGPVASELMRRMGHRHGYGHAALNAGVLVLDLDRMRRDEFTATYLAWVERYGVHDQDVMLAYAGADRYVLDPRWNALPVLEDVVDPAIIHWAKQDKPWLPGLTFQRDLWQDYAERVRARLSSPAPTAP
jgi:lipopolysaccharide biosynthesis glycosyltransferase